MGQAWAAARCLRHARRITRRSSSEVPPQTPVSWLVLNELEAGGLGVALIADILGVLDLLDRHPGGADGEEEARVGVATMTSFRQSTLLEKASAVGATSVPLGYGDPSDVSVGPDTGNRVLPLGKEKVGTGSSFSEGSWVASPVFRIKYRNSYLWPRGAKRWKTVAVASAPP